MHVPCRMVSTCKSSVGWFFLKCLLVFWYGVVISVMDLTLKIIIFIACVAEWVMGMAMRLFHPLLKKNTVFNLPLTSDSSIKSLLVRCQL